MSPQGTAAADAALARMDALQRRTQRAMMLFLTLLLVISLMFNIVNYVVTRQQNMLRSQRTANLNAQITEVQETLNQMRLEGR